ncbi:MAG: DUF4179 domain-containing protein [Cellulosilyticaceae bacterium]
MDKKLYELLNDTETVIKEEDEAVFTELDKRRMKMNINKKIGNKRGSKKGLLVASALLIGVGVLGTTPVLAQIQMAFESIADHMNSDVSLENYATILDETVTKQGVTMGINEVILNNDEMIISSMATADEVLNESGIHYWQDIYINGVRVDNGGGGSMWQVDDYSMQSVTTMAVEGVDLTGELDVKVVFNNMIVNGKDKWGKWSFAFKTTGDELAADTKEVAINHTLILENGEEVQLDSLRVNDVNSKIYYRSNRTGKYDIKLEGHDDLGNEVIFYLSRYADGKGQFELQFVNDELKKVLPEGSKTLTLTPYAVAFPEESGKMSDDFEVVGEPFTIDLEKLQ